MRRIVLWTALLAGMFTWTQTARAQNAHTEEAIQVTPEDELAQTSTQPIPASLFGDTLINSADWPTITIGSLGKGAGVAWPYIERQRGVYDWSRLDAYVNAAVAHGVSMMYSNQSAPPWAVSSQSTCSASSFQTTECSGNVANLQDWKNFVTSLVTRYKGRIQAYELWNEPENGFSGTITELVALTNAEHDIIRSLDPSASLLSPSTVSYGYEYLDEYFAAGGTKDIDAIGMHAYPNPNNDIAETITTSMTSTIRSVMSKYGLSNKAIWDTENSWGYASKGATTNKDSQAAFVARSYLLHWSMGITRNYWYSWDNPDIGTQWSSSTGILEPGTAYSQVYKWMVGATMSTCSVNGASSNYHALYTCDFTRGTVRSEAVWYTDGNTTYTASSLYTKYLDLAGDQHSIPSNHQITVGTKPVLLQE